MTGHPQDDLPGLLLGELPPATAAAVDQHLAGCDPCRRDLAAVAVASSALRDASRLQLVETSELPPLQLPVAAPTRQSSLPGRRSRSRWLLGATAVVVALLLGIGALTFGRDGSGGGRTIALAARPGARPRPRLACGAPATSR